MILINAYYKSLYRNRYYSIPVEHSGQAPLTSSALGCLIRGGKMPHCCVASPEKGRSAGGGGGGGGNPDLKKKVGPNLISIMGYGYYHRQRTCT